MDDGQKVQRIIDESVKIILAHNRKNIKAIFLFGSYADNTAIWRSDIDICVLLKGEVGLKEATLFRKKMLAIIPEKVDLQVFNVLPLKIKKSIADNHKVLFESREFNDLGFIHRNRSLFFELERKIASIST